jgi:small-conductance mechanosensitive channel/CRP-like cAMP-binding protein
VHPYGDIRSVVFGKDLRWLLFVAITPLIFFGVRLLDTIAFDFVVSRRSSIVAPQLLRAITSIALYCLLFGWSISAIFHYSITGWLALPTVLAAVIGLALQDTLGNLAAGIALHLEDSFDIGDVLHSGDLIGVVEGVSWRATTVRSFDNSLVILPNALISRERLEVFPRGNLNGRVLKIGVDYHVPPATVIATLTQAVAHVDGVARELPCIARVGAFADSAVVYDVKYYTHDYAARDRIDAEIRKAIWYALQRNDISIAFPIRAYQTYTPPKAEHHDISRPDLLAHLEEVDILAPLDAAARERVADAARVHYFAKGETIIKRGAAGDSMFVVHTGKVSVRVPEATSSLMTEVAVLGPGNVFGEMALLTGEVRTADVAALVDTTAFEIAKEALQPILQSHPELATAISTKVMERRDSLASLRSETREEEEQSVLTRIRAYFGL